MSTDPAPTGRYNSLFDLTCVIEHAAKDGSDLTAEDFRAAVLLRLDDLDLQHIDGWRNAASDLYDTYDKEND